MIPTRWPGSRVYPRVCGGACDTNRLRAGCRGLSPRVRGSLGSRGDGRRRRGSIPACAGEPAPLVESGLERRVYPRVCGGAVHEAILGGSRRGLSPRVRGSRRHDRAGHQHRGSIPACAGEPFGHAAEVALERVYPRVCGGARWPSGTRRAPAGLSPRVRGSHCPLVAALRLVGSIPACAGEPLRPRGASTIRRVYPRVCGGAEKGQIEKAVGPGLSPRVRGSPGQTHQHDYLVGSIPACAGEPCSASSTPRPRRVYPRVCGGAPPNQSLIFLRMGLSPRVRGSPRSAPCRSQAPGSIPACAGEPALRRVAGFVARVYPRVCGGAILVDDREGSRRGLSPRVRGSRYIHRATNLGSGSIPACAGEP